MKKINKTITAGGIIINEYKEVVIVNQNHDSWSLPKGHVEDNETILETAKREIYEETGLSDIEFIKRRYIPMINAIVPPLTPGTASAVPMNKPKVNNRE